MQKQVILKLAEDNLDEELKNVDEQLEEYRNSLVAYAYEREYIREKLDTTISSEEVEKYYNEHPDNFQLKDNIIKCIFLRVPKNAPKIDRLRVLYKSEKKTKSNNYKIIVINMQPIIILMKTNGYYLMIY